MRRSVSLLSTLRACLTFHAIFAGTADASYKISDAWTSTNFFDGFNYDSIPDPTHGAVTYVDAPSAQAAGLVATGSGFVNITVQAAAVSPRQSVRLISKNTAYLNSLIVADIYHQPGGVCGAWPAFWLLGQGAWPDSGEIDIMEGVNDCSSNTMTLHTSANFTIDSDASLSRAAILHTDCTSGAGSNQGCGMSGGAYGSNFNAQKGGMYAVELSAEGIKIWFFDRSNIPAILQTDEQIDNTKMIQDWGKPLAFFKPTSGCSIADHFKPMNIIINTDICGDWASGAWGTSPSCSKLAATCNEYVAAQANAFLEAYWTIKSVRVYALNENNEQATTPTASVATEKAKLVVPISHESSSSPTQPLSPVTSTSYSSHYDTRPSSTHSSARDRGQEHTVKPAETEFKASSSQVSTTHSLSEISRHTTSVVQRSTRTLTMTSTIRQTITKTVTRTHSSTAEFDLDRPKSRSNRTSFANAQFAKSHHEADQGCRAEPNPSNNGWSFTGIRTSPTMTASASVKTAVGDATSSSATLASSASSFSSTPDSDQSHVVIVVTSTTNATSVWKTVSTLSPLPSDANENAIAPMTGPSTTLSEDTLAYSKTNSSSDAERSRSSILAPSPLAPPSPTPPAPPTPPIRPRATGPAKVHKVVDLSTVPTTFVSVRSARDAKGSSSSSATSGRLVVPVSHESVSFTILGRASASLTKED